MTQEVATKKKLTTSMIGVGAIIIGIATMAESKNGPLFKKVGLPLVIGGMLLIGLTTVWKPEITPAAAETPAGDDAPVETSDDDNDDLGDQSDAEQV